MCAYASPIPSPTPKKSINPLNTEATSDVSSTDTEKSPGFFHTSLSKEHLGLPMMALPMFGISSLIRPD